MLFDGYVVSEENPADAKDYEQANDKNEDTRVFAPYKENGVLSFHTEDRFFCTTPKPLPEGLCGAPALDTDGDLCGVVEGIVPTDHKNEKLAGAAAFLPSYELEAFVDLVERGLVQKIMPSDLYQMVVESKKTNTISGGQSEDWEATYDETIEELKKRYSKEELDQILASVERERKEAMEMFQKEGGDLDEIIERVRTKSLQIREMIRDQYRKGHADEH